MVTYPALTVAKVVSLNIEVFAAILSISFGAVALVFHMRNEYKANLREVWKHCLEAHSEVRVLYRMMSVSEPDFLRTFKAVIVAIDSVRSVYRNVGETDFRVGFYPFATLHDIRLIIDYDQRHGVLADEQKREKRLEQIESLWRNFRRVFLHEFRTAEPETFVIDRLKKDDRREGVSFWRRIWLGGKVPRSLLKDEDLMI